MPYWQVHYPGSYVLLRSSSLNDYLVIYNNQMITLDHYQFNLVHEHVWLSAFQQGKNMFKCFLCATPLSYLRQNVLFNLKYVTIKCVIVINSWTCYCVRFAQCSIIVQTFLQWIWYITKIACHITKMWRVRQKWTSMAWESFNSCHSGGTMQ